MGSSTVDSDESIEVSGMRRDVLLVFSVGLMIGAVAAVLSVFILGNDGPRNTMVDGALAAVQPGAEISEYQSEMLIDGFVSDDEYYTAADQVIKCLEEGGISVRNIRRDRVGSVIFNYGGGPAGPGQVGMQVEAEVKYAECYGLYQSEIDMLWHLQRVSGDVESKN